MLSIGLTGSFGTGKSTVAKMMAARGAKVLDADKIAHDLISKKGPCFKTIVKKFGGEIMTKGKIDRKKLANVVFNDPGKLKTLEAIIHPHVAKVIKKELAQAGRNKIVVVEVPLLFESGLHRIFDRIVVVTADPAVQMARLKRKTKMIQGDIKKRIKRQMPMAEKIVLADHVINNSGTLLQTRKQVQSVWNKF